jgi:septal ring factor EnvC (AmiA/AmiB activator)
MKKVNGGSYLLPVFLDGVICYFFQVRQKYRHEEHKFDTMRNENTSLRNKLAECQTRLDETEAQRNAQEQDLALYLADIKVRTFLIITIFFF